MRLDRQPWRPEVLELRMKWHDKSGLLIITITTPLEMTEARFPEVDQGNV